MPPRSRSISSTSCSSCSGLNSLVLMAAPLAVIPCASPSLNPTQLDQAFPHRGERSGGNPAAGFSWDGRPRSIPHRRTSSGTPGST
jgi:hypothetical protein